MACAPHEDSIIGAEVEEYLRTADSSTGVNSMSSRSSDSDNMLLWPETLYPDMYGKTLHELKKRNFLDAEEFTPSIACVATCTACVYASSPRLFC
jgi:hypothetical protein